MENQKEQTITCGVGRFVIDIPVSMQYRSGSYSMRTFYIKEEIWPGGDYQKPAQSAWETHLAKIEKLKPPEGKEKALIEVQEIPGIANWCSAVFYNKEYLRPNRGYLDIFFDAGSIGVWITSYGKITGKDFMYEKSTDLAKAYRPPAQRSGKATVLKGVDAFYLEHGAIDLPFEYRESVDIGFKGHALDKEMALSIETHVVQKVQKAGLVDRLSAAIAVKFAPGVKVEKIRTGKRMVAGLDGEEIIIRGTEDGETALNFQWNYPGQANSGNHPEIIVIMDSRDRQLKAKTALWDSILDSMRPAGR